jgi:hypothetical protein
MIISALKHQDFGGFLISITYACADAPELYPIATVLPEYTDGVHGVIHACIVPLW